MILFGIHYSWYLVALLVAGFFMLIFWASTKSNGEFIEYEVQEWDEENNRWIKKGTVKGEKS